MTTYLNRDAILGAVDLPTEDVSVPEWGGAVRVRGLTAHERDFFEGSVVQVDGQRRPKINTANIRAKLASLCIIDEEGQRLFTDKDVRALGEKSAVALNRVFEVAQRLSGLSDADVAELEGNSASGQNGASPSA